MEPELVRLALENGIAGVIVIAVGVFAWKVTARLLDYWHTGHMAQSEATKTLANVQEKAAAALHSIDETLATATARTHAMLGTIEDSAAQTQAGIENHDEYMRRIAEEQERRMVDTDIKVGSVLERQTQHTEALQTIKRTGSETLTRIDALMVLIEAIKQNGEKQLENGVTQVETAQRLEGLLVAWQKSQNEEAGNGRAIFPK